jgi:hypothetical protein
MGKLNGHSLQIALPFKMGFMPTRQTAGHDTHRQDGSRFPFGIINE